MIDWIRSWFHDAPTFLESQIRVEHQENDRFLVTFYDIRSARYMFRRIRLEDISPEHVYRSLWQDWGDAGGLRRSDWINNNRGILQDLVFEERYFRICLDRKVSGMVSEAMARLARAAEHQRVWGSEATPEPEVEVAIEPPEEASDDESDPNNIWKLLGDEE